MSDREKIASLHLLPFYKGQLTRIGCTDTVLVDHEQR